MTEKQLMKEVRSLLVDLKSQIEDDMRADYDDEEPGIRVTVGAEINQGYVLGWGYQTGDTQYMGTAYHYPNWGVGVLYRDSHCGELAAEMVSEVFDHAAMMA